MRILIAMVGTLLLCTAAVTAEPTNNNQKRRPPRYTPPEQCDPCDPFTACFKVDLCSRAPFPGPFFFDDTSSRAPQKKKLRRKAVPK